MMSVRLLLGVMLGMLVCAGVGSAAITGISANPPSVNVPIGGYNQSIISVTVDSPGPYNLYFSVGTASQSIVSANLTGPYTTPPDPWTINSTFADSGSISWYADAAGTYYFVLNITTDPGASVGQNYAIATVAVDYTTPSIGIAVVQGPIIPELITAALVAAGLVAVIIWRRWS